jgi:hypothetical protein
LHLMNHFTIHINLKAKRGWSRMEVNCYS